MRKRSDSSRPRTRLRTATNFGAGWLVGAVLGYAFTEVSAWYRTPSIDEVAEEISILTAGGNIWHLDGPDAAVWRKWLGTPTMISTLETANWICWSYHPPYPWGGDSYDFGEFGGTFLEFCFDKDTDQVNLANRGDRFPSQEER